MSQRIPRLAALVALAALWSVGAWLLWRSTVPSSLRLPHLSARRLVLGRRAAPGRLVCPRGRADLDRRRARRARRLRALRVARRALRARVGGRADRHRDAARDARLRAALARGAAVRRPRVLVGAPARAHARRLRDDAARELALARRTVRLPLRRPRDRDVARPALRPLVVGARGARCSSRWRSSSRSSRRISPRPMRSRAPALRRQVATLESEDRGRQDPGRRPGRHEETSLPNAEAMGIGPSRRVVLWDTIVDGRFSDRELAVVIAHELGHVARDHVWKSIGWFALFAFPGTYLIARVTRRRGGMAQAGGGAARPAHARRPRVARPAAREPDHAPHGGRGGLGRAPDDARPAGRRRCSSSGSCRRRSATRTRRCGTTSCARTTRR